MRLFIHAHADSRRKRILDRMGESQSKNYRILLRFRPVSHSDNVQFLLEPFGDAANRIGYKCSGQSMKRSLRAAVVQPDGDKLLVLLLKAYSRWNRIRDTAFRSRHNDCIGLDVDLHL